MELYLLRHAEAEDAVPDEARRLTVHGREQAAAAAAGIAALHLGLTHVFSSPLVRAVQTAEYVVQALAMPLETSEALATSSQSLEVLSLLGSYPAPLLLVGHEPQLSGIVQAITSGRVHMRKSMLARVELESTAPALGYLAWLLAWRHLKKLA